MFRILALIFLNICIGPSIAQNKSEDIPAIQTRSFHSTIQIGGKILFYTDKSKSLSPKEIAVEISKNGIKKESSGKYVNFEKGKYNYWGSFSIENNSEEIQSLIFNLHNPYLDKVRFYELVNGTPKLLGKSGDKLYLEERTIAHREHIFELNLLPNEQKEYLFLFERWAENSISFELSKSADFISSDLDHSIVLGIFLGVLIILGLYGLVIFLFNRKRIFLLYAFYAILNALSLANINGLGYRYIYGNLPEYSDYFSPISVFLIIVVFALLSLDFLNVKSHLPKWHKLIRAYIFGYTILATIFIVLISIGIELNILPVHYFLVITTIVILLVISIKLHVPNKKAVQFYLASFLPMITAVIIRVLHETGILELNFQTEYLLIIGSLLEILILSAGISVQLRDEYQLRLKLSEKVAGHKKRLAETMVEGENQEKRRIALVLHDTLGVKLRRIKSLIKSSDLSLASSEVDNLADEIRDLSHSMAPTILDYITLQEAISDISYSISSDKFKLNVIDLGFPVDLPKKVKTVLYNIIQELINNIVKHSECTKAIIQFTQDENTLSITLEDDGKGFDPNTSKSSGLGLISIESRVTGLGGQFTIESAHKKGTLSIIELPNSIDALN
ncbi:MAG: signal transduction histidine kinase [Flavobacteriaceae bacterium]|jgi:signal transduction histidine kinase